MPNTDGRTALDAAKALGFDSVLKFLTEQGAVAGVVNEDVAPTINMRPFIRP
jgi:hypothetical protein